jgi:glycosyltransferase involved in cell wall biosynthesis
MTPCDRRDEVHSASSGTGTRPIRALWLIKGLGPGGAERILALSARHRSPSLDVKVAYLLAHKQALVPEFRAMGVELTCFRAGNGADWRWVPELRRLLAHDEVDLVHVHSPVVAVATRLALLSLPAARRPKLVTTEHNVWSSHARATRFADRVTAGVDDLHIAVSRAVRDSMPKRLHDRTVVVQHGIDVEAVQRERAARVEMRRALDVADDELVVGTVANLRATKGYPDLMAAAVAVAERVPAARFVAVGQGPQEESLRHLHGRSGLGDRFRFLGWRDDATRVMSAFDVFCLASHHEGLPIALMEALALGLPVVATDVGGVAELVGDGHEARLVPPRRPELLTAALIEVLEDEDRRERMAAAARARGGALDAQAAARDVEALYHDVLSR